jgi:DNA-binding protein HU-beta
MLTPDRREFQPREDFFKGFRTEQIKTSGATINVEAFVAQIQAALSRSEPVTLVGFRSFSVQTRAARKGRHPRTGQDLIIAACKAPKFSPGKPLREAVTSPSQGEDAPHTPDALVHKAHCSGRNWALRRDDAAEAVV